MSRIKIIPALLLLAIMGSCSKSDPTLDADGGNDTSAISLGSTIDWSTKGVAIDDLEDVKELTLYSFDAYAADNWESLTSVEDLAPFFTTITTPLTLETSDYGQTWDYTSTTGGTWYWRADDAEALTFFALYPASELTTTFDETSGKPIFSYSMSEFAAENDDLVVDALYDLNNSKVTDGKVEFLLQHALTKLSLEVALSGAVPSSEKLGYYDEETETYADEFFFVNGISFSGLYDGATLDIELNADGTARTINWILDEDGSTIELTAAQSNTILPIYDYYYDADAEEVITVMNEAAILKVDEFLSVMEEGEAIFVLPQLLDDKRDDAAPTAKVRIRRLFYTEDDIVADDNGVIVYYKYENASGATVTDVHVSGATYPNAVGEVTYYFEYSPSAPSGEMLYSSEAIVIPSADNTDGWVQGEHNLLQFTFNLTNISEYDTPLTLTSQIYSWTAVDVEATVHANTYIYSSDSDIVLTSIDETAEVYIYTNYEYDLRRHKRNIELDGSSTEAAGFTFYTSAGKCYEPLVVTGGKDYYYVYDDNDKLYLSTTDGSVSDDALAVEIGTDGVADMSEYEDENGWMTFKIKPTDEDGYSEIDDFTYKVQKSTRGAENLYINSTIESNSYGVNKSADDAVYILSLDIDDDHLYKPGDGNGYFAGSIGAELLSNGGGKITYKFDVTLEKALN